jgi:hypothetical protein
VVGTARRGERGRDVRVQGRTNGARTYESVLPAWALPAPPTPIARPINTAAAQPLLSAWAPPGAHRPNRSSRRQRNTYIDPVSPFVPSVVLPFFEVKVCAGLRADVRELSSGQGAAGSPLPLGPSLPMASGLPSLPSSTSLYLRGQRPSRVGVVTGFPGAFGMHSFVAGDPTEAAVALFTAKAARIRTPTPTTHIRTSPP